MAKRKAGVNDIIYELDNEDIEISSEDEGKEPKKIHSVNIDSASKSSENTDINEDNTSKPNIIDNSDDTSLIIQSHCNSEYGGKSDDNNCVLNNMNIKFEDNNLNDSDVCKKSIDESNTILYNEDMVIDSPASNTDLGVVGCENRTPLITLRFKDRKLANNYKKKVKEFMLSLIKLHNGDQNESDDDTDVELDIWPEDLIDIQEEEDLIDNVPEIKESVQEEDNFFFIDTAPCDPAQTEIPKYSQVSAVISNSPEKVVEAPKLQRRGPTCFNCEGAHPLRDCTLPRDHVKIAEKRKTVAKVGRYHVEDDQKFGHLVPGRISGQLRHALGLKRSELPLHIYRMRMLGYPPGWLEEARISHSGITMFDSTGSAILDPEDEEGEYCEPGSKDKFDIKKILDFPGFNVPASSRYVEGGHLYGLPPISEQDSKLAMLQTLAPNAMKAYKRKKLTFFPSTDRTSLQGQAEMELDSGDEAPEFLSVPPLPDEAPPLPPPPPASPPPPSPISSGKITSTKLETPIEDVITIDDDADNNSENLEIIEVMKVMDIPIPEEDLITLDEDTSTIDSGHDSLTLDDLEKKKMELLNALEGDNITEIKGSEIDEVIEIEMSKEDKVIEEPKSEPIAEEIKEAPKLDEPNNVEITPSGNKKRPNEDLKTPDSKAGQVKTTLYGTPVVSSGTPYSKLPSDDKFAKDICDVINFENLPNSTGKYKKICSLLKKVKTEVDRIQES